MDGSHNDNLADEPPAKKRWTVKKLPIKGGHVLRSAMLSENDRHTPQWVQVEGEVES